MTQLATAPATILYESVRSYRNRRSYIALAAGMIICLWIWGAVFSVAADVKKKQFKGLFAIASCLTILYGVGAYKVVANKTELLRVTLDGVEYRGEFTPWSAITEIRPNRGSFTSNVFICIVTQQHPQGKILMGQKLLKPTEYFELAQRIHAAVVPYHPALKVS